MVYNKKDIWILHFARYSAIMYSSQRLGTRLFTWTSAGQKERSMYSLNVGCIILGVIGFLSVVASATKELVGAYRLKRESRRRYIKD